MASVEHGRTVIKLSEDEAEILETARTILYDLWVEDECDDECQGNIRIENPSFTKDDPSAYNGMIDTYDAAEVIDKVLMMAEID